MLAIPLKIENRRGYALSVPPGFIRYTCGVRMSVILCDRLLSSLLGSYASRARISWMFPVEAPLRIGGQSLESCFWARWREQLQAERALCSAAALPWRVGVGSRQRVLGDVFAACGRTASAPLPKFTAEPQVF